MKLVFAIISIFSGVTVALPQTQELDSLIRAWQMAEEDTNKVLIGGELAWKYLGVAPDKSEVYANESLELARKLNFLKGQSQLLNHLGEHSFRSGEFAQGIDYVTQSLDLSKSTNDSLSMAHSYRLLGLINNFGLREYDLSISYYLKALDFYLAVGNSNTDIAILYSNIAWLYANTNQKLEEARKYAEMALSTGIKSKNVQLTGWAYNSIGLINFKEGKLDSAVYHLELSNKINLQVGDRSVISYNNSLIGDILLIKEDYRRALVKFNESIVDGKAMNTREVLKDSYLGISKTLVAMKRFEEAVYYRNLHDQLKDSLVNWEIRQKMAILKHSQDLEREASQITILENEKQIAAANQRVSVISLIGGMVFLLVVLALVARSSRQRKLSNFLLEEKNLEIASNNEHLKEVVATKDKLFSILGHDLRGPISSVKGVLSLVGAKAFSPDELNEIIPELTQEVGEVYATLENLLDWSQSQLNGIASHPEPLAMRSLIEPILNLYSQLAASKSINVEIDVPAKAMAMIDKNQADVIFRNVISNAIKFTQKQGSVRIYALASDGFLEIVVRDSGIGMSSEKLKNLFNHGPTLSTFGTDGEKGTGIGLLLAKDMIESNGGRIIVESEEGLGSEFKIYIPEA